MMGDGKGRGGLREVRALNDGKGVMWVRDGAGARVRDGAGARVRDGACSALLSYV